MRLVFDLFALTQPVLPPLLLRQSRGVVGGRDPLVDVPDPRRDVSLGTLEAQFRVPESDTMRADDATTLSGIPKETYEYRLGNRSALEWVVDQYQVSTDKRSGITNDPNRADDPRYIVRLIGQVITVSLETAQLVRRLKGFSIVETAH